MEQDRPQTGSGEPVGEPVADPTPPPATTTSVPPTPPPASTPPPAVSTTSAPRTTTDRPTGVTILAVLAAIGGVLGIFAGLTIMVGGAALGVAAGSAGFAGLAGLFGALTLAIAIGYLAFAWGAWGLRPWAWTLGVGLAAVSIVLGVFQLIGGNWGAIVSIAIAAGIAYYLFQPEIQAAFGRR